MQLVVYALFDPRVPSVVRYIGLSANVRSRVKAHISEAKTSAKVTHKLNWLRKVLSDGVQPEYRVLDVVATLQELSVRERQLIAEYRAAGHNLTNGTAGGDSAYERTQEMADTRSEINRRRWADPAERERYSQQMKQWWESPEAVEQRRKHSEFAKAQHRDPNYGGGFKGETARQKISASKLGKPHPHTPEWDKKIGDAQRGISRMNQWTPERRAAHAAKLASPETRAKMSASAKARIR